MADLDSLKETDNLKRAWRWIKSNPDALYKSYFRGLYQNYAIAEEALLSELSDRLGRDIYEPRESCKLFFPKTSGILRPYSLLTVEDQIVYQSAVNIIAEKLFPKVKHRYYKSVFGHLYAGKRSIWFYRKWSKGYKAFNDAARKVFEEGYVYSASFDLTACYDSLDHRVLKYFLKQIGLDHEFCEKLASWLEKWTATESRIYHNHGIPQGPLSSGLLSEVVLSHFDSLKVKGIDFYFFRYVDDIRLFAKNEKDLRRLLVALDLMSKDIGLFPQSNKISIHKIDDIEEELKSVSNPPEHTIRRKKNDQDKVYKRLVELSPRYLVSNFTRFKYVLAQAEPNSKLTNRLWRILENHPELYKNICNYLKRYRKKIPRVPAQKILGAIRSNTLYQSVQAEFIQVANGSNLPDIQSKELTKYFKSQWAPGNSQPDFFVEIANYLMRNGELTDNQYHNACTNSLYSWWSRATLIDSIDPSFVSKNTLKNVVNTSINDSTSDVSLASGLMLYLNSITPEKNRRKWNPLGSILSKELGVIKRKTSSFCGIEKSFNKLLPNPNVIDWEKLFGKRYKQAEKQAVEVFSLAQTNITAFVNALDVFNDLLLDAVFGKDSTIGSYTLGHIGSVLNPSTSRFAKKYPKTYLLAKEVHNQRYKSMYSHPKEKRTAKPTQKISYRFLGKAKALLKSSIKELHDTGF